MNLVETRSGRSTKTEILLCLSYTVLIVLGVYLKPISLLALAVFVLIVSFSEFESVLFHTLYVFSFANIFKFSPSSVSFVVVIQCYLIVLIIIRGAQIKKRDLIAVLVLMFYAVFGYLTNNLFDYLELIKFIVGIVLICVFKNINVDKTIEKLTFYFTLGVIISSIIAFVFKDPTGISGYITYTPLTYGNTFSGQYRFSGLSTDPNYYTLNLVVSMAAIISLRVTNRFKNNLAFVALLAVMCCFGVLTYSKSFLLMVPVLGAYYVLILLKNGRVKPLLFFCLACVLLVVIALSGVSEQLNYALRRFTSDQSSGGITTHRMEIWLDIITFLKDNTIKLLFGMGLGNFSQGVAHNTYIECLASFGVIGSIVFVVCLSVILIGDLKKITLENGLVVFCVFIIIFFLNLLTWIDFSFQVIMCYCFLNLPKIKVQNGDKLRQQNPKVWKNVDVR